jgi:hypothetical protein
MSRKLTIGGIPLEVLSDDEANECDFIICMPATTPSPFDDNLTDFCCKCGIKVIYRWHAPRQPPKLCIDCMFKMEDDKKGVGT